MRQIITFCAQLLLAFCLTILVYARLWGNGIPLTHDGPIHVVRMASYYLALQQGQFPPRLGPNMANGLGYPVFNFNYPLANMVATGFIRLHVNYPTAYQLTVFLFIGLGTLGIACWLKRHAITWPYRFIGMVLYITNPFLIAQVFVRGGVGEIAFIGVLPWVLWSISIALDDEKNTLRHQITLGIIGGLLALSHNVLVVFCIPLLAGYATWNSRHTMKRLLRLIIPVLVAFLLSAYFWIPALFEKNTITLDDVPITQEYERHFLWPHQFFSGFLSYGYSRPGPVDGMSFRLSIAELGLILLLSGWYLAKHKETKRQGFLWLILLLSFLLITPISSLLWQWIPFGNYIQFPWRLLWFEHMGLLLAIVWWLKQQKVTKKWLLMITLVCFIEAFASAVPQQRTNRTSEEWLRAGETTNTMNENAPKTLDLNRAYQVKDVQFGDQLVWVSTPSAHISITTWDGTKRSYQITTPETVTIVERTAFFPGWETRIAGKQVETTAHDPWGAGLITYTVPAGEHTVQTTFTQRTPARRIGNGLTLVGILMAGGGWIWAKKFSR